MAATSAVVRRPSSLVTAAAPARHDLEAMVKLLTPEQKLQVEIVTISNWLPTWFYASRLGWCAMPGDARERAALQDDLRALAHG
jgi:hypothetical protein